MKNPLTSTIGLFLWVMGVAIVLAFSACEKDKVEPEPLNVAVLPGVDYLGRGYDAFGEFASADELKATLLDFNQYKKVSAGDKEYKIPEEAEMQYLDENTFQVLVGETVEAFQNNRMESVGLSTGYPFFSDEVTANFQAAHYRTREYAFAQVSNTVNRWAISLPHDAGLLRAMLTEEAKSDLANLSPTALFTKYGTHLLTAANVGIRADYYVAAEQGITTQLNLAVAAEVSLKASLGLIGLNGEQQQMVTALREHSYIGVKTRGGSQECGKNIFTQGYYQDWLNSVDDNLTLSALPNPSLMPVWNLCESSSRKAELEEAFQQYAAGHGLPGIVTNARASITEILIKSGIHDNPYYYQEAGYKVIPENLNEGNNGDYVFLMYKEGLDVEESINELATVSGVGATAPAGWFRITANLNEGTGSGDPEIYLCYKKAFSDNPVRQLKVLKGEDPTLPSGFEVVKNFYYGNNQNLNHGAGGEALYLAFSRNESQP